MDSYLILTYCIALLYWESRLQDSNERSKTFVRTWLERVKPPEAILNGVRDREQLLQLKDTCVTMLNTPDAVSHTEAELLSRIRLNTVDNEYAFQAISGWIIRPDDMDSIRSYVRILRSGLIDMERKELVTKMIREASSKISFHPEKISSMSKWVAEIRTALEPFEQDAHDEKSPHLVVVVDLDNPSDVAEIFRKSTELTSTEGLMLTGWQDLNEALQGGLRRGQQVIVPAQQHNFKTGFTLSLFAQVARYNIPYLIDKSKKPCMVHISFENEAEDNFKFLFENIYYNQNYSMPVYDQYSDQDKAEYILGDLRKNGYAVKFYRFNPSEFTYRDLFALIIDLERKGYEIHLCMIDYLRMMNLSGCEEGPAGHALRDLFRRTRNFFSAKKIAQVTPHQLSTDSVQLIREGFRDFVKQLPGRNYFEGSKQIGQEADLIMYIHIEVHQGKSYLTFQREKHRGVNAIPETKKYFALPFPESGPIPDDLHKVKISVRKLGASSYEESGTTEDSPYQGF